MSDIPTNEPLEVRAGLTWQWRRDDLTADYPASVWTLTYWFKKTGSTGANFNIVATADGDAFSVNQAPSDTQGRTAGDYTWSAVVSKTGAAHEVDAGRMEVKARYDQAANLDDRSHARKVLEAIEAVLEGRATKDQEEYTIGDRSLKRTPITDLMAMRDKYRGEVFQEDQAELSRNGLGGFRAVVRL